MDDEEYPWVRYVSLPQLHTVACCCDVAEYFLAVGTDTGYLLVFDRRRDHELRFSRVHESAVVALSLSTMFAISASVDQVAVYHLQEADKKWSFDFSNCLAVSVHSDYVLRQGTIFLGDQSGLLRVRRPFTARTGTLPTVVPVHQGEGSVDMIRWSADGNFVAWHNDRGVKVLDCVKNESVTFLALDGQLVRLCWSRKSSILIVSCDSFFKVLRIHPEGSRIRGEVMCTLEAPEKQVVCGVCPDPATDHEFFVLTCGASSNVHLVGPNGTSETSTVDTAHVMWHQTFLAYHEDIYVVAADGIRQVLRRDAFTHANWFVARGRYDEALEVALGKAALIPEILGRCVSRALKETGESCDSGRAMALIQTIRTKCPEALTIQLWEDIAMAFAEEQRLDAIAPTIPPEKISRVVADLIFRRLLVSVHLETLLLVVHTWSRDMFSVDVALALASYRLKETDPSEESYVTLSKIVSCLYVFQGNLDQAFKIEIDIRSVSSFALLEENEELFVAQFPNVDTFQLLVDVDACRCAQLYVQYYPFLAPKDEVIRRLDVDPSQPPSKALYLYCKALSKTTVLDDTMYEGVIKSTSAPYGFIESVQVKRSYTTDVSVSDFLLRQEGLMVEDSVIFTVHLNDRGNLQATQVKKRTPSGANNPFVKQKAQQSLRYIECLRHFGDRGELLAYLEKTETYNVEDALKLIRSGQPRNLEAEVYLLGRNGLPSEALTILLSDTSEDKYAKAARFIHDHQGEKDLWQQLVDFAMQDPQHRIAQVLATWELSNPIPVSKILQNFPPEMGTPKNIASVLTKLLADFHLEASLHRKCTDLGEAETARLARERYELRHQGALLGAMHAPLSPHPPGSLDATTHASSTRPTGVSTGMRCVVCGDPCFFGQPIAARVGTAAGCVMHERCACIVPEDV